MKGSLVQRIGAVSAVIAIAYFALLQHESLSLKDDAIKLLEQKLDAATSHAFQVEQKLQKENNQLLGELGKLQETINEKGDRNEQKSEVTPRTSKDVSKSCSSTNEFQRYTNLIKTSSVLSSQKNKRILHSETLMRNSRPIIGNLERLQIFIRKLLDKKCTRLLFVGGSVTHAIRDVDGVYLDAYHSTFVDYLNERFPCKGGEHKLFVHGPGGTDAAYAIYSFDQLFHGTDGNIDFLTFEYAINDSSAVPLPGRTLGETVQMNTEILMRKALLYRNKDGSAPALLYIETSFFAKNLLNGKTSGSDDAVHMFAAGVHFPILTYYEIPTVSAAQVWFARFARYYKEQWEDPKAPFKQVFSDKAHPSRGGHIAISQLMAMNLELEMDWMLKGPKLSKYEGDLTLLSPPVLPQPWWFTDSEEEELVRAPSEEFNFQSQTPSENSLYFNTGWKVFADSKDKFGLIATKSASHVAFKFEFPNFDPTSTLLQSGGGPDDFATAKKAYVTTPGTKVSKAFLGHLRTYQGISSALVWLDDKPDGTGLCNKLVVENPGACYAIGCRCDMVEHFTRGRSSSYAIHHMKVKQHCVKGDAPIPEGSQVLNDPVGVAPREYDVQLIDPKQRVHTSVYSHYDVRFSPLAIEAATKGKPVYMHLCTLRIGELSDLKYSNALKRPEPKEGDAKFKLLLVGAKNGKLFINTESERMLGRRLRGV